MGSRRIIQAVGDGLRPACIPYAAWLLLVMSLLMPESVRGQDVIIDREAKIKAAYLLKLATYVEWPAGVFKDDTSPLVFGVVGKSDVSRYMKLIARLRKVGRHSLTFKEVDSVKDACACHVLFVAEDADDDLSKAIRVKLAREPVLFVGEESEVVTKGEVFTFVVRNNRVRLQLSKSAADQRHLKIGSQLAKLAQVID